MKTLFLDALQCRNQSRPPIWLMRQAGRYMPSYRAIREKHSFIEMCHQPELAAQITLLPIKEFGFDAAILFSDILMICEALGMKLEYKEKVGPVFENPIRSDTEIDRLSTSNIQEKLHFVGKTIRILLPELDVPLIGFCGGPFTVASYMIEGGTSRDFKKTKQWMLRYPESFHRLLQIITHCSIDYLNMQMDAGVHALQIFESWAHVLSHAHFMEFSLEYLKKIIQGLKNPIIPLILFCRGSSVFAKDLAEIKPAAVSLDWNANIANVRNQIGTDVALQGNLDPDILYGPPSLIRKETKRLLNCMKGDPGYIFNLGHGIKPDIPTDAVKTLIACVNE